MKTKTLVAGMLMMIVLSSCTATHKAHHPDKWLYDAGTKKYYRNAY